MSFFVGMLNINEMYKVCSDFCGVRRWKWFLSLVVWAVFMCDFYSFLCAVTHVDV